MTQAPLYQICGQFPQEVRDSMRIQLDGVEFSYGSEEYVRHQQTKVTEFKVHDDVYRRQKIIIAYTKPQKPEVEKEELYKPEQPRYGDIGV